MDIAINDMIGKTFVYIEKQNDEIVFVTNEKVDGKILCFKMYHYQDCCENVYIKDIVGEFDDIMNEEIIVAIERTNQDDEDCYSCTWTFYEFATNKGSVNITWYGESNGYYSEKVNIDSYYINPDDY